MKKQVRYFCGAFFITLVFISFFAGLLIVDSKTNETGFAEFEPVLELQTTDNGTELNVMGHRFSLAKLPEAGKDFLYELVYTFMPRDWKLLLQGVGSFNQWCVDELEKQKQKNFYDNAVEY